MTHKAIADERENYMSNKQTDIYEENIMETLAEWGYSDEEIGKMTIAEAVKKIEEVKKVEMETYEPMGEDRYDNETGQPSYE